MSSDAIIFDLKYTPYNLPTNTPEDVVINNKAERAFFDMTGSKNVYDYITTEGKRIGAKTALDYLQKNTGVFNQNGMISEEEVEKIKERAKNNEGNIWHGFISLSKNDSPKIDTPEKCINLVKRTFGSFFKEGGFKEKNMDLLCALHLDKPHHLHIHFVFFEKEPTIISRDGKSKTYRRKGKVNKRAIDNMYVRVSEFISDDTKDTYTARRDAVKAIRGLVSFKNINASNDDILKEIIALKKDLPKTGRLSYESENMKPLRGRVDNIVKMLLDNNGEAQAANMRFYIALEKRRKRIEELCKQEHKFSNQNVPIDKIDKNSKYRYSIDEKNIKIIEGIKEDYKRRQGNLIINLAKAIDEEYYERNKNAKYKANSNYLKRRLTISKRKVKGLFNKFFMSFGNQSQLLERDFSNRLQEIEEEMQIERDRKNKKEVAEKQFEK